jgi:assimilatory nitrate reductase electron transfer subunit
MKTPKRVVVIGNGMAGARAVRELRRRDPAIAITVLGAERCAPYNRILLTDVLAGQIDEDDIFDRPADQRGATVHTGVSAVRIDRERQEVITGDGGTHPYDSLVLATGSTSTIPDVPGLRLDDGTLVRGAVGFRTLEDCHGILRGAHRGSRALVLGGGLLGLEAARALAGRGVQVTVLHPTDTVMNRQLSRQAADMLTGQLAELGVAVRRGAVVSRVRAGFHTGTGEERLTGVELTDGTVVPADLLIVACGVTPETGLAAAAGLTVGEGVAVDASMRTSDSAIYAIGDCTQLSGRVSRLVDDAWSQAKTAADAITGTLTSAPAPVVPVTRLKADDIDLTLIGACHPQDSTDGSFEVLTDTDPDSGRYQRIVLSRGRILGATILGDHPDTGVLTQACRDRRVLTPHELARLARLPGPRGDLAPDSPDIGQDSPVCYCRNVPKSRILESWSSGARTVSAIARTTRATTGCGICRTAVKQLLKTASAEPGGTT